MNLASRNIINLLNKIRVMPAAAAGCQCEFSFAVNSMCLPCSAWLYEYVCATVCV